jgi:flagellar basal-body rod modification protein FlgD
MPTTTPIDTTTPTTTTPKRKTGPDSLTSSDFMNLMLKQLQSQDPLNPTDSNALLQQFAQISTLQSNQTLQTSLTNMTLQQSIGSAGNLIGKAVQGIDEAGNNAVGAVKAVKVVDQKVYLQLDNGSVLPMQNVIGISTLSALSPTATNTAANSQQQQLAQLASALQALGLN